MVRKPARLTRAIVVALGILANTRAARRRRMPPRDPVPEKRAAARRAFEDDRFGLFIHWGVYSLVGEGEWVMEHDKLPISEYAKLPPLFNAKAFDAEVWVKLAKAAGARYITVTAKHHDGFCMFDSRLTDYDIVDSSPYHADPLKALADACQQAEDQAFLLLFALGLASRGLLSAGQDRQAPRAERSAATGSVTWLTIRDRSANCAATTATSAGSGLTAGGIVPMPRGAWPARTGSSMSFSRRRWWGTTIMSLPSPARIFKSSSKTFPGKAPPDQRAQGPEPPCRWNAARPSTDRGATIRETPSLRVKRKSSTRW